MTRIIQAILLTFLSSATLAEPKPAPPPPVSAKCAGPEYRQFDFWIGHWNASSTRDGSAQGVSLIERLYDGCTLRENWIDPQLTGGSLNTYVAADGKWHQLWTDSSGAWREFIGGLQGSDMVLIATYPSRRKPGFTAQERMTFTPNPDGSVRQHMMMSSDGVTWVEGYDYTYRRTAD